MGVWNATVWPVSGSSSNSFETPGDKGMGTPALWRGMGLPKIQIQTKQHQHGPAVSSNYTSSPEAPFPPPIYLSDRISLDGPLHGRAQRNPIGWPYCRYSDTMLMQTPPLINDPSLGLVAGESYSHISTRNQLLPTEKRWAQDLHLFVQISPLCCCCLQSRWGATSLPREPKSPHLGKQNLSVRVERLLNSDEDEAGVVRTEICFLRGQFYGGGAVTTLPP